MLQFILLLLLLLLLRLPLARPVLPVAATYTEESTNTATHIEESTSAATTGAGDTLWETTTLDPLHVPPPLPRSLQDRIRRGKFVMFDKLLLPQNVPPTPEVGKGNAKWKKRHVVDLPSWLEAWNRYILR